MMENSEQRDKNLIAGRGPVTEALKNRAGGTLYLARGKAGGFAAKITALCKEAKIPVKEVSPEKLDRLCPGVNHQGVVLSLPEHPYADLDDIFEKARQKGQAPFVVVCDEMEDPRNLGAVIRTAECAGAHGVVIPARRAASLTFAVSKAAAGALEYVPVARVTNLAAALETLKERGLWVYGADMEGTDYRKTDFRGPVALVVGSEGKGISRLVREKCDFLVSIPMVGNITSLNASVAAGILMYEVLRTRLES